MNIDFIIIVVTRTHPSNRNASDILVLNIDPASHFCPVCAEKEQN